MSRTCLILICSDSSVQQYRFADCPLAVPCCLDGFDAVETLAVSRRKADGSVEDSRKSNGHVTIATASLGKFRG